MFVSPSLKALARGSLSLSPSLFLHKSWWLIQYPSFLILSCSFFQWSFFHCISGTHSHDHTHTSTSTFLVSCTHKITFTDHTACGQMQLTSQRERGLINPGPARNFKGSEDQFPVTPVFIHEITRHLRPHYYRWILYVLHKPNFKKSTLWLRYLIFPTILWLHQDVPTRSWSTIIFSLSFTSLTSSVFISNLESMIYHHNHYFNFLAPLSLWQNPNSN